MNYMEAVVLNGSYYVPLIIANPFNGKTFPENGSNVLALIDSGFDGFILINKQTYYKLGLNQLKPREITIKGICCVVKALKYPIRLLLPDLNLSVDGEAIYYEKNPEILVGTEFLSNLKIKINGCKESITLDNC